MNPNPHPNFNEGDGGAPTPPYPIQRTVMPVEPWNQTAGFTAGPAATPGGAPPASPLAKAHQLLRGRYRLALVLAGVFGVVGAAAGYLSQSVKYESNGLIEVKPVVPDIDSYDRVMLMYNTHMQSQVAWLKSERLVRAAMERPEWKRANPGMGPSAAPAFNQNLTVEHLRNTPLIQITYADRDPDVAPAAVKAVIGVYRERFSGEHLRTTNKKIEHWENTKDECLRGIDADKRLIEDLAVPYGYDDLSLLLTAQLQEQVRLDAMVRDAEMAWAAARDDKPAPLGIEDIGRLDTTMGKHIQIRNDLEVQMEQAALTLGASHPSVTRMRSLVAARDKIIEKYAEDFRTRFAGERINPDGTSAGLLPRDPAILEAAFERLHNFAAAERKKITALGQTHRRIQNAKAEITELTAKLKEAEAQLEKLNFQKSMVGELNVISDGDSAAPASDRRAKFAALGLVGGAGLPVALLMLLGLLDARYRYSDEANTKIAGIQLLGILPNLPDRLSDPEQAAIAAHCVHQIRTMLQINGAAEARRVFAVTSAAPGDGKTSLTLALGLSYAACGSRTLLVDCDLVGAGLTHRMNVNAPDGVLEAIAGRSLLPYVRPTDINDVSILPVGSAQAHHASTLSPAALRRLIGEAESHFETILIDTGPLLGSIEAPLVCSTADGVILTVARGQQRPLVERSLGRLNAIGAKLTGMVFNKAEASDFERSVSGMSMRSVSRRPVAAGDAVVRRSIGRG